MAGLMPSNLLEDMPRFRCESCCCGPAIVLHPPRGATPICSNCGTPLTRQPLVRPMAFLVLIAVGSVLALGSFPLLLEPRPDLKPGVEAKA